MATEYLDDVRSELQSRATRTTLEELKRKGLEQVRVIRSSQILALIEQAVDRAMTQRGESPEDAVKRDVLQDSAQIFRELLRDEMKQGRGPEAERMSLMQTELQRRETELDSLRGRVAERDAQLAEARSRTAELDAELRVTRQRIQAASPQDLLDELRSLRKEISKPKGTEPGAGGGPAAAADLKRQIESFGAEISSQIERIGRRVGVGAAEETPTDLSGLFTSIPDLESNLDSVEAKVRKGSDVDDALARMRSLRKDSSGA
jgi:hypothetical protein